MATQSASAVRGMYRSLLRTVQSFPPEAILEARTDGTKFAEAASEQIRATFKANMGADAASSSKLFAAGQKELVALRSLVENDCLKRHPGPRKEERLHKAAEAPKRRGLFSQ
mmetsp:Transcript_38596/g.90003  ORF Transcript_38596/g.90003 Transcript_38596/m.90003 type:complete len:112 (+) Transcript_38596:161-496(+)